jgi:hypothetical protein
VYKILYTIRQRVNDGGPLGTLVQAPTLTTSTEVETLRDVPAMLLRPIGIK